VDPKRTSNPCVDIDIQKIVYKKRRLIYFFPSWQQQGGKLEALISLTLRLDMVGFFQTSKNLPEQGKVIHRPQDATRFFILENKYIFIKNTVNNR